MEKSVPGFFFIIAVEFYKLTTLFSVKAILIANTWSSLVSHFIIVVFQYNIYKKRTRKYEKNMEWIGLNFKTICIYERTKENNWVSFDITYIINVKKYFKFFWVWLNLTMAIFVSVWPYKLRPKLHRKVICLFKKLSHLFLWSYILHKISQKTYHM